MTGATIITDVHTAQRRGRLPREEADRRVERLMEIALREFSAYGFGGTSLNRLVALSGVSKTTIVSRFGNKEGLFRSLLDHSVLDIRDALRACAVDDPAVAVRQFVETLARFASEQFGQSLLRLAIGERTRFPELAKLEISHARETFRPIADYLALLMDSRAIEPDDPLEAAFELVAMTNHGFRMLIDDTGYLDLPGRAAAVARRFLIGRGFCPKLETGL